MVRVNITRDELTRLKMIALSENKTSQELFAELLRVRLADQRKVTA